MSRRQQHAAWKEEVRCRAELSTTALDGPSTPQPKGGHPQATAAAAAATPNHRQQLMTPSRSAGCSPNAAMVGSAASPTTGDAEPSSLDPPKSLQTTQLPPSSSRKGLSSSSPARELPTGSNAAPSPSRPKVFSSLSPAEQRRVAPAAGASPSVSAATRGGGVLKREISDLQHQLREYEDREQRLERLCFNLESHVVELTREHDRAVANASATIARLEAERNDCLRRNRELTDELELAEGREKRAAAEAKLLLPGGPSISDAERDAKQRNVVRALRDELTGSSEQRAALSEELQILKSALTDKDHKIKEMQATIEGLERKVLEVGLRKTTPPPADGSQAERRRPPSPVRAAPPPIRDCPSSVPVVTLRPVVALMGAVRHSSPTIGVVRNSSPPSGRAGSAGGGGKNQSPTPRGSSAGARGVPLAGASAAGSTSSVAGLSKPPPRAASPSAVRQQLATASFLQTTHSARQRLDGLNCPNVMTRPRIAITSSPIARKTAIVTSATGVLSSGSGVAQAAAVPARPTRVTPVRTSSPFRSAAFETTFRPTRMIRHNEWNEPH